MNRLKTQQWRIVRRLIPAFGVLLLLAVIMFPALHPGRAAAAQLTTRSIEMSDSGASAGAITTGVGSGTNVTYRVSFTTSVSAQSLIIDFCSEDAIIGDTCTAPTAFTAASAVLSGVTGNITSPGWTVTASTGQVQLAKGSGSTATAGVQSFDLTGITNPSTVGTFYARIYTYADTSFGGTTTGYTSAAAPGDYKDYGGIALSTVRVISITARVQEQLTFCVSGAAPATWATHDCTDANAATAPVLVLGHGTPTPILDSSAVDTGTVYSQISTNATSGAIIRMRNSNIACGGLSSDGGTTCGIPATNAGAATPAAITSGTAAFGLFVTNGTADVNGIGTVTADANYNDGTATHYGMDTTSAGGVNVIGTFGDPVAASAAPVYRIDNSYTFAATASLTTPAGIYTANMDLIATGTF